MTKLFYPALTEDELVLTIVAVGRSIHEYEKWSANLPILRDRKDMRKKLEMLHSAHNALQAALTSPRTTPRFSANLEGKGT